ncbi:MAG: TerB family tellurite resistance protein [Thiotrichaceae bacterium]
MKNKIISWLGLSEANETLSAPSIEHAATVLMVEIMHADHYWDDVEAEKIVSLLIGAFQFTEQDARDTLKEAQESVDKSNDLYYFTRVVNEHYKMPQKEALIKSLWKVAYADNEVDRYEEHMIRKIAELLYVPHSRFIKAKLDAIEE